MELTFDLKFERDKTGLWHVYSEGTEKTLYVAHRSLEKIINDLPAILKKAFEPELREATCVDGRKYMRKHHARRKRRQAKMKLRSHGKFKVNHKSRSGRTGG